MAETILTSIDFTYTASEVEEVANKLQLKLQDRPDQQQTQTFDSDTGFTYDTDKAEFDSGQVQQTDQRSANSTCAATYDSDINLTWGDGVLTGTATGGAAVVDGKLDLTGGTNKYVSYDADGNADAQQTGCIRFKYTPNYSGSVGSAQYMINITDGESSTNRIRIYHSTNQIVVIMNDYDDSSILLIGASFLPTAGVTYEIEFNWDITSGASRLFIDGVQAGTTSTDTGTRDSNITLLRIGADRFGTGSPNFEIEDLIIFDAVQHTNNYTPGYTVPSQYAETNIILPAFTCIGPGDTRSLDLLETTESGTPRYILNGYYFNGVEWSESDETYDQANSKTDINSNLDTLVCEGVNQMIITIIFPDGNTQNNVSNLTITYTDQIYPIDNPTFELTTALNAEAISEFTNTDSATGNDAVTYILSKDDIYYYWNGSAWVESDETYAESSSGSDISTNIATFNTDTEVETKIKGFLHSEDGTTTPDFTSITLIYTEWVDVEFVVEDGTGKSDATSYATVAQYKQYWKNRGVDRDATYTDSEIKGRLNLATEYLDTTYQFKSIKNDEDNALEWPRIGFCDQNDFWIDSTDIPQRLIDATCYLADKATDDNLNGISTNARSISYGPVSKSFAGDSSTKNYKAVDKLLKWLVVQGKTLVRVN